MTEKVARVIIKVSVNLNSLFAVQINYVCKELQDAWCYKEYERYNIIPKIANA